jgi:hypothetical protein
MGDCGRSFKLNNSKVKSKNEKLHFPRRSDCQDNFESQEAFTYQEPAAIPFAGVCQTQNVKPSNPRGRR